VQQSHKPKSNVSGIISITLVWKYMVILILLSLLLLRNSESNILVNTREKLLPDPQQDPVQLIFWCLQTEDKSIVSNGYQEGYHIGVIALKNFDISKVGISNRSK
jgi:hypothetical protein